jgi:hypothetical protein
MLAKRARRAGARTFVASDRHRLEVNYYDYRRLMMRLNRRFGAVRRMRLEPVPAGQRSGFSAAPAKAAE